LLPKRLFSALDLMVLPGLIYIIINNYIPMAGLFIAFKKIDYSKGLFGSDWIGFDNFKYLFLTEDAFIITRNTILYNLCFIVFGTILGITVGILLSELVSKTFQKIYQTIILLPHLFSIIIVAYIVYAFLSNEAGFINKTILGSDNAINFYASPSYWPFILVFVYLWKGVGYSSIIYLSAIISVDKNLYESATVDGVSRFKQIFYITLPCIKPTIVTLVMLSLGRIFYSDFGIFYQVPMNAGALYNVTNTIDTYVYRGLMLLNNLGMASAAGAYQSIVGFCLILTVNGIMRKVDRENAML
jgi:putative aldouronate transport system permease protein